MIETPLKLTAPDAVSISPAAAAPRSWVGAFVSRNWRAIWGGLALLVHAYALFAVYDFAPVFAGGNLQKSFVVYGITYLFTCIVLGLFRSPYTSSLTSQVRIALKAHAFACIVVTTAWMITSTSRLVSELVVIIGAQAAAATAAHLLLFLARINLQRLGWALTPSTVVLLVNERVSNCVTELRSAGFQVATMVHAVSGDALETARRVARTVDTVWTPAVIIRDTDDHALLEQLAGMCEERGVRLVQLSPRVREILKRAHVDDASGITIYAPERRKILRLQRSTKRAADILLATLLLMLTLPILFLSAIAIRLDSAGAILYRQRRALTGEGVTFAMLKFRSMYEDATGRRQSLAAQNQASGALFKIRNDPRITRVGKILRKFSIDELPQIINVLRGEMSLVGPRPLPVADYDRLTAPQRRLAAYRRRDLAVPGITGLWQIAGRSDLGFEEMVSLDAYYVEHASLFLDLHILIHTVPVALLGRGAY